MILPIRDDVRNVLLMLLMCQLFLNPLIRDDESNALLVHLPVVGDSSNAWWCVQCSVSLYVSLVMFPLIHHAGPNIVLVDMSVVMMPIMHVSWCVCIKMIDLLHDAGAKLVFLYVPVVVDSSNAWQWVKCSVSLCATCWWFL